MIPRWLAPAATPFPARSALAAVRAMGAAADATDGPHARLGAALLARFGGARVSLTDSGTSALQLAIAACCPSERPVALPAFGCYDLITAAQGAQRRVVVYDVDPHTLAPVTDSVAAALAQGAGALVVTSTFGYAPDMPTLAAMAAHAGVPLIEDIAQGGGARWDGQLLGRFGAATVLSFGRGKGLGGAGGGALVLRDAHGVPTLREAVSRVADAKGVVFLALQQLLSHPRVFALPSALPFLALGETVYHPPHAPRAMGAMQAAVAARGVAHIDAQRAVRAQRAEMVTQALAERADLVTPIAIPAPSVPGWLRVGAVMPAACAQRLRSLGVRRSYPVALPQHPALRPLLDAGAVTPGAIQLAASLVSLPSHDQLRDSDITRLATHLRREPAVVAD